jgi:hypothetical protein
MGSGKTNIETMFNGFKPLLVYGMYKTKRFLVTTATLFVLIVSLSTTTNAEVPYTLDNRAPALNTDRYGDLTLGAVIRTDERYGHDPLFQGPRGWDYWNRLQKPRDYQNPNIWGDKRPTYFVSQVKMPKGAKITIRGRYPHARYFKFALYHFVHDTYSALTGEDMAGWDIAPDDESSNPFVVGADRTVEKRDYTVHIVAEDAPAKRADRARNTLYAGGKGSPFQIIIRVYASDEGYDGAGLALADTPSSAGPAVTYEGELADGSRLSAEEVVEKFAEPIGLAPALMPADPWYALVNSKENDPSLDPSTAPARKDPPWQVFRGMNISVGGAFKTLEQQMKIKLPKEAEAGADPTTVYIMAYLSRKFGSIYTFRAKMPTFPDTYAGAKTATDGQVVYWSVETVGGPPSGQIWDGVFGMMVPLDEDGNYTIVVSRPEDRPKNATKENGVMWIDWGPGEGSEDPRNRTDWGMLLMRYMVCAPDWKHSPAKSRKPGSLKNTMGPYYPAGYYTTKAEFEKEGPKK